LALASFPVHDWIAGFAAGVGGGGGAAAGSGGAWSEYAMRLRWMAAGWLAATLAELAVALLHLAALPWALSLASASGAAAHLAAPLALYPLVLAAMALAAALGAMVQRACALPLRAAAASRVGRALGAGRAAGVKAAGAVARVPLALWGRLRALAAGAKAKAGPAVKSGEDLRAEFRSRRAQGSKAPGRGGGGGSGGSGGGSGRRAADEGWLAGLLAAGFAALHVDHSSPLQLRGLVGVNSSLAHELACVTLFASGSVALLLASFLVLPAYADPDQAK
jgi:hypothetical protein